MRLTLLAPALCATLVLAACGSSSSGGPDNEQEFYPNCDEQSALATLGRTDGRQITITCPVPGDN